MIDIAGTSRPKPGERSCGDAWLRLDYPTGILLAVIDGLGHGPEAAEAARVAVTYFEQQADRQPDQPALADQLLGVDRALHPTRGAVVGLAFLQAARQEVQYAGVGNIEVRLFGGAEPARLFSQPGLLGGGQRPRVRLQSGPFRPGDLLVLHTDGLTDLEAARLPRVRSSADLVAALLIQGARATDDAAVVAARWQDRP